MEWASRIGRAIEAVVDWPLVLGQFFVGRADRARRGRRVLVPLAVLVALALFAFFIAWALSPSG